MTSDINTLTFLGELKDILIEELEESRTLSKRLMNQPKAQIYPNVKTEILEKLNLAVHNAIKSIKEGVFDMAKLKSDIKVVGSGKIEDLMVAQRGGTVEPKILEVAKQIPEGEWREIDSDGISYAHFDGRVRSLVKKGALGPEYKPLKRGNKFFIARFPKDQLTDTGE